MSTMQERIRQFFDLQGFGLEDYLRAPKDEAEAADCFMEDLSFGTAGLRSAMDVGFNRMNEVTVKMASMGIAQYLKTTKGRGCSVVIGHDHRNNSRAFAECAAGVFSAYGHSVKMFSKIVPTPFVPSAVRSEGCDLGVMITASHNPKRDNGYKVYADNGAQIDDSTAVEMLKHINEQRPNYKNVEINKEKQNDYVDCELLERVKSWYIEHLKQFLGPSRESETENVKVVYTALHGVGAEYVDQVFEALFPEKGGFLVHVESQKQPDPEFPTVEFPNPEEGASTLKLATRLADELGIKFVFANDPDADRFCVAEKINTNTKTNTKEWKIFNGNEIAVLLADHLSKKRQRGGEEVRIAMLASCVSSRFLQKFCANRGWRFESTATGFKNLGNCGIKLKESREGYSVLLAYEEAIGFQVGDWNFDKDGISALATFYQLLLESNDSSLSSRLERIYEREACWPVQCNGYYFCNPAGRIKAILSAAEAGLLKGSSVKIERFAKREGRIEVELRLEELGGSAWLMLRSSGTEPKLKYYSELMTEKRVEGAEEALKAVVEELIEIMIEPNKNNLIKMTR